VNLSERLHKIIAKGGDITAITFNDVAYSWAKVGELVHALGAAMATADPRGETAAIVLRNRPVGAAAMMGVVAARRTTIMITPIQPSISLCADVRSLNPSLVIADRQDWNEALEAAVRDSGAAGLEIFEENGAFGVAPRAGLEHAAPGHPPVVFAGAGMVVPTSGTTGPPKRVPVSWERLDAYAPQDDRPITQHRGVIQTNPLVTVGGSSVLLTCAARPMNLLLMERLDVAKWADLVERYKPPRAGLPPAGMRMLVEARLPKEKFAHLECFVTGSAPLSPEDIEAVETTYGKPLLYSYGATEFGGSGTVANWTLEDYLRVGREKRGSSGKASPGVSLRVVDPATGEELPAGEQGVLEVKQPTAPVQPPGGWIRTNDLAVIDADGYLFIRGRADDVIIRGGFKVPLPEVVAVLEQHPGVHRAAAIGLPDERLGQVPGAAVVLNEGFAGQVSEADLIAWAHDRLSPYKVPTRIKFVDAIPMTQLMKVSRPQMRALFED
jgi:acyl-coenzyme A synthetase/AMP-(fatty) acid ligase